MIKRMLVVAFVVFGFSVVQAGPEGEDVCIKFREDVVGKTFVAKAPLYDTKVAPDRIVKLERDKEEIPKGRGFKVVSVSCGSGKIQMGLRQVDVYKADKVEVYLLFGKKYRYAEDAEETLKQITDQIYEEPKSKQPADS